MNTRREFLTGLGKLAGGILLAEVTLPILQACAPSSVPLTPEVGGGPIGPVDVSDLSAGNPAKVVPGAIGPDGFGIMITRVADSDFRALSMRCTHQNCPVDKRLLGGDIHCNCHGSLFGLDGTVKQAAGPNQPPLTSYKTTYDAVTHLLHLEIA